MEGLRAVVETVGVRAVVMRAVVVDTVVVRAVVVDTVVVRADRQIAIVWLAGREPVSSCATWRHHKPPSHCNWQLPQSLVPVQL